MDQDGFAFGQPPAGDDIVIDSEHILGQAGRFQQAQACGDRQAERGFGNTVIGIAATDHQRADGIAKAQAGHARAERDNRAGDFEAGHIGGPGGRWIAASALQAIGTVDTCSRHFDQDLTLSGHWYRAGFKGDDLGAAGSRKTDLAHGCR